MVTEAGHHRNIFFASFMTLIAAGIGFGVRGAVLKDWGAQYGFTQGDLGSITGGGFIGFGIVILISSLFVDKVGYKAILLLAFVLHVLSVIVTFMATPVFNASGKNGAWWVLFIGMFMFAIGNGLCEAVINPLTATIYPKQKTHYLNILHAGWPGGMILGALIALFFVGEGAVITELHWEIPMALFLIPVVIYGIITIKEKFPVSEAMAAGVKYGDMLKEFAAPVLLLLLLLHAMVGYVELGTDGWITNIMNNVIEGKGLLLFMYAAALMFVLRFFAGPIVHKINPLGLLFVSAVLAAIGLYALGSTTTVAAVFIAGTVYALGKTFFWPTMLGVVGERFPRGGALTMGAIGGVGMLSAGILGLPGIGYTQDWHASKQLEANSPAAYAQVAAEEEKRFLLVFPAVKGLNNAKVDAIAEGDDYYQEVTDAKIYGGRMALKITAVVPAIMAVGYLILVIYFRSKGGYKVIHLDAAGHEVEDAVTPGADQAKQEGNEGSTGGQ